MERGQKIKWPEKAVENLATEAEYIAQESLYNAKLTVFRIEKSVERLRGSPKLDRIGRVGETRELIVKKTPSKSCVYSTLPENSPQTLKWGFMPIPRKVRLGSFSVIF